MTPDKALQNAQQAAIEAMEARGRRIPVSAQDLAETRHFLANHGDASGFASCLDCDEWGDAAYACLQARASYDRVPEHFDERISR